MTQRLIYLAGQDWQRIDGLLASRASDPLMLPFDRFLNLIYWWVTEGKPDSEVAKFNIRLWRPPPGVAPTRGPWSAEAETAAFKAFKSQINRQKPAEA